MYWVTTLVEQYFLLPKIFKFWNLPYLQQPKANLKGKFFTDTKINKKY